MRRNYFWAVGTGIVAGLLVCSAAFAGRLEFGAARVDGENVIMPIVLSGDTGTGVSTMNFDLKYDPQVFEPVHASEGAAAKAADKQVQFNVRSQGDARVIVVGLNQSAIENGEVANVVFKRVGGSSDQTNLRIVNTAFASADASEVPSRGDSQAVRLDGSADEDGADDDNMDDSTDPTDNTNNQQDGQDASQNQNGQNRNTRQNSSQNPPQATNPTVNPSTQQQMLQQGASSAQRSQPISTPVRILDEGGSGSSTGNPGQLSTAMKEAESARASISNPAEGSDSAASPGDSAEMASTSSGETATPAGAGENEAATTDPRMQVAKADDSGMADGSSPATPGNATAVNQEDGGGEQDAATSTAQAQTEGGGSSSNLLLIIGAVVAAGIVGLLLVRKKLFA